MAAKFLFNNWISPFPLVQLRLTVAAVTLFVWVLVRHPTLLRIYGRDLVYFVILGTCGMAAVNIAYMFTVSRIQLAAGILLEYLGPVFIAVYCVIFASERNRPVTRAAMGGLHPCLSDACVGLEHLHRNRRDLDSVRSREMRLVSKPMPKEAPAAFRSGLHTFLR